QIQGRHRFDATTVQTGGQPLSQPVGNSIGYGESLSGLGFALSALTAPKPTYPSFATQVGRSACRLADMASCIEAKCPPIYSATQQAEFPTEDRRTVGL